MSSQLQLQSVSVHLPEVGEVTFERRARARRVTIYVKAGKGVLVVVPARASLAQAEAFVEQKLDWIKLQVQKWQQLAQRQTLYTESLDRCTNWHALELKPHAEPTIAARLSKEKITVRYPEYKAVTDEEVQAVIRKAVEAALRAEARQYLPYRLAELAAPHGLAYQTVTIKNTRTRWGSCSSTNNINLSLHLMRLPGHLCDYVLLHELAHIIEKNHGPRFWKLLDKLCAGKARALDKELKSYRIAIF